MERDATKWRGPNDGTRSLFESAIVPELALALKDWKANADDNYVLIGGYALSFYTKPRYTQDIDVLVHSRTDISDVAGFKSHRASAMEHKKTGVEVEFVYPGNVDISPKLVDQVFQTAHADPSGIKVASAAGLVALKMNRAMKQTPAAFQDRADILGLLEYDPSIDIKDFDVTPEQLQFFYELKKVLAAK